MKFDRPYDICGWATKFNVKCDDGRTIEPDAFNDCDGQIVPFIWQHDHDNPENVLGHALLQKRGDEGMYTYCWFNRSPRAKSSMELIKNGDINSFSIYANKLKHHPGGSVYHGKIREVSLVLGGANPGALIEFPYLEHGADGEPCEDEAVIYMNSNIEQRAPKYIPPPVPVFSTAMAHTAVPAQQVSQEVKKMPANANATVKDVLDSFTEEQRNVMYFILGELLDEFGGSEDSGMKHNVFDNDTHENSLSHADIGAIFENAKRRGSLKEAVEDYFGEELSHAVFNDDGTQQTYGVANINYLFPDYKELNTPPDWIKRDQDWVSTVMDGVHHTPYSRIKTTHANITMDEARALGYIKGDEKKEEVFDLLRRSVDPQTIYKKQALDKDDIRDITDFNVVAWIKGEMRKMLDEEAARAILIGDGRSNSDQYKIRPEHIKPIWGDDELYTIPVHVTAGADISQTANNAIKSIIRSRRHYKGSGNLTYFTTEEWLCEMLLLEDGIGHPLYADKEALARKLRVNKIVTVPVMENQTKDGEALIGIIVDLRDYNVGADKGASVDMFEDFDIDFNKEKYLIETRFSGMLTKPYSAMAVTVGGKAYTYTETTVADGDNPSALGYYEKSGTVYFKSKDTTAVEGKTYYKKTKED